MRKRTAEEFWAAGIDRALMSEAYGREAADHYGQRFTAWDAIRRHAHGWAEVVSDEASARYQVSRVRLACWLQRVRAGRRRGR